MVLGIQTGGLDREWDSNNMEGWKGKDYKESERIKDLFGGPWNSLSMLYSTREAEAKLEWSESYSILLLVPPSTRVLWHSEVGGKLHYYLSIADILFVAIGINLGKLN